MAEKQSVSQRWEEYRPSKTALFWSCVGSVVVVLILGFTWGGWTTGGTAADMAEQAAEEARAQVVASVCVEEFMRAPEAGVQLASLQDIDSAWQRGNFIEEGGWVTIAGEQYDEAAEICAEHLMEREIPEQQEAEALNEGAQTVE